MSDREKLKRYSNIGIGLIIAGVLFYLIFHFTERYTIIGVIGLFMVFGGAFSIYLSQFCPNCHRKMSTVFSNIIIPEYCPHCGKKIE